MMSRPTNPHVPHAGTELYDVSRDELVAETPPVEVASAKQNVLQRLVQRFSVLGLLGLLMVLFWLLVAFVGPLVAP